MEWYSLSSRFCRVEEASSMGVGGLSLLEVGDIADATASQSRRMSFEAIDSGPLEIGLQHYMLEIIKIETAI